MLKSTLITASVALAAIGGAAPAMAQDDDAPRVLVRYDDLNLSSAAGRQRLDTRVRLAIRSVCMVGPRVSLRERAESRECEKQARLRVDPQVALLLNGDGAKFASEKPPVFAAP